MCAARDAISLGVLLHEWILPKRVIRDNVWGTVQDLFAVVTREQPVLMIDRLSVEIGRLDQWFSQVDRIGDDCRMRQVVPVPDEELDERGLIALGQAVA